MGTCGAPSMMGGRRKTRKQRTMRGGAVLPGFGGTIGTAGAIHTGTSLAGPVDSATGKAIPDPYSGQSGGRRRRGLSAKTMRRRLKANGLKTSGKKSTLSKRMKKARLMKGGASQMIPGNAAYGFDGSGSRGLANAVPTGAARANDVQSA